MNIQLIHILKPYFHLQIRKKPLSFYLVRGQLRSEFIIIFLKTNVSLFLFLVPLYYIVQTVIWLNLVSAVIFAAVV